MQAGVWPDQGQRRKEGVGEAGGKPGRRFSYPSCSAAQYHDARLSSCRPRSLAPPARVPAAPGACQGSCCRLCKRAGASGEAGPPPPCRQPPGPCTLVFGLPAAPALRPLLPAPLRSPQWVAWLARERVGQGAAGVCHARGGSASARWLGLWLPQQLRTACCLPGCVAGTGGVRERGASQPGVNFFSLPSGILMISALGGSWRRCWASSPLRAGQADPWPCTVTEHAQVGARGLVRQQDAVLAARAPPAPAPEAGARRHVLA